jgi:hypothetical protein
MTTESKQAIGFKPDLTFKRIANGYRNCAYIYDDGILAVERKEIKVGKNQTTSVSIWHLWRCNIKLTVFRGDNKIARVVCHNASVLLDGIKSFESYRDNASESMKKLGIVCDSYTLTTLSGAKHRIDDFDFLSSDVEAQYINDRYGILPLSDEINHPDVKATLVIH